MPQGKGTYGSEVGRPPKKNSPMGYNPFRMKAGKGSGYDNSPMKKNYGQFGVGTSEMPTKPTPNKFGGMMGGSIGRLMQSLKDKKAERRAQATGAAGGEAAGGDDAAQSMMDKQAGVAVEGMEGGKDLKGSFSKEPATPESNSKKIDQLASEVGQNQEGQQQQPKQPGGIGKVFGGMFGNSKIQNIPGGKPGPGNRGMRGMLGSLFG